MAIRFSFSPIPHYSAEREMPGQPAFARPGENTEIAQRALMEENFQTESKIARRKNLILAGIATVSTLLCCGGGAALLFLANH